MYHQFLIKRLAGRNWRFISLRGSEAPGFAFGSPASRRCAAGAARRTRFHPGSPSAHLPAAAARRAPLAELAFTRVRLRLTRKPPLRGGRRSPNSFFIKYFPGVPFPGKDSCVFMNDYV